MGLSPSVYAETKPTGNLVGDLIFSHGERWAYETTLLFRVPSADHWSPVYLDWKLFGPDAASVYIEFDSAGRVKTINIPPP